MCKESVISPDPAPIQTSKPKRWISVGLTRIPKQSHSSRFGLQKQQLQIDVFACLLAHLQDVLVPLSSPPPACRPRHLQPCTRAAATSPRLFHAAASPCTRAAATSPRLFHAAASTSSGSNRCIFCGSNSQRRSQGQCKYSSPPRNHSSCCSILGRVVYTISLHIATTWYTN